ncbi:MAG: peptidoglycan DD-metalloendopeptidase family protein [Geminicoccaceae bacterium]
MGLLPGLLAGWLLLTCGQPAVAGVVAVESAEPTAAQAAMAAARAADRRFQLEQMLESRARLEAQRLDTTAELRAVDQELRDLAVSFRELMARRDEATAAVASRGERVLALQRRLEAVLAELMQLTRAEVADRRRIAQLRAIAASYVQPFADAKAALAASRSARQAFTSEELELRAAGLHARTRQLALERQSAELGLAEQAIRVDLTEAAARDLAARREAQRTLARHERVVDSRRLAALPNAAARLPGAQRFGPVASRLQPAVLTARAVLDRQPERVAVLFGGPAAPAVAGLSGMGRVMPVAGAVVGHFGQGPNALLDKGITIAVDERRLVRAPRNGRVAFAGPFKGFGLLLIIEHGDEYHSLLSGLSRLAVPVGATVRAGQMVGTLEPIQGHTAQLYVELRRRGVPVNPLPWLAAGQDKVRG